jgi:hypothetical protein
MPSIAVTEAKVQFANPDEQKHPPLETATRGLMKMADWEA